MTRRPAAAAAALAVLLSVPAGAAPREFTDPEVGLFAREAAGVSLSRGATDEEAWRKGLAAVATPAAVGDIDAAWRAAGYDPEAGERPRYLASPGMRADVHREGPGHWHVDLMVAQSYQAKALSGARGLRVGMGIVLDGERLAVERLTAEALQAP